jgi:ATP synthase protein I
MASSSLSLRPFRVALGWQAAATLVIAAIAGAMAGGQAALSAVLGGVVTLTAGVVYAFVARLTPQRDPGTTVVGLFRAEAAKIVMIVAQLWLLLSIYRDVVLPALLAAFIVTVLLSGVALLVRT